MVGPSPSLHRHRLWNRRQRGAAVDCIMRQNWLTEMGGGQVGGGRAHQIHHIHPQRGVNIVAGTNLPQVLNQHPPFDIVGTNLASATESLKIQGF